MYVSAPTTESTFYVYGRKQRCLDNPIQQLGARTDRALQYAGGELTENPTFEAHQAT
jgi:hypothetical protein